MTTTTRTTRKGVATLDTLRNVWTVTTTDGRVYRVQPTPAGRWAAYRGSRFIAAYDDARILCDRILDGWVY